MLEIYSLYISNCINKIFLQLTDVPGMISISDQMYFFANIKALHDHVPAAMLKGT